MADKELDPVVRALLGLPAKPPASPHGLFGLVAPTTDYTTLRGHPPMPLQAPRLPVAPLVSIERLAYFAFDFDDIIRVNNVRNSGKIGPRINGNSRGFKDRSIWEKSNAKTKNGLKRVMQFGVKGSGVVCVLIGSTTWQSFWVRYEIAQAIIGERGLLAVDLNSINHSERKTPDPLGVNPLHFMGVYKHNDGKWYLVERKMVETANGAELKWDWYDEYTLTVPRPAYVQDVEPNTIVPLAPCTDRYDYMLQDGSAYMGQWFDMAAKTAGR